MIIRDAEAGDETRWRQLWAGYNAYQEATVAEAVTAATWRRVLDPAVPMFCRMAVHGGRIDGFALCVLHEGSWVAGPICYLEDLFVDPAARQRGIGRALIEDLSALGKGRGWSRLYWHADGGNANARRLYDSFVPADKFVRYRMSLE